MAAHRLEKKQTRSVLCTIASCFLVIIGLSLFMTPSMWVGTSDHFAVRVKATTSTITAHLLRAPEIVRLETHLQAHASLGPCFRHKSLLPQAVADSHCEPLYCLQSPRTRDLVDMHASPLETYLVCGRRKAPSVFSCCVPPHRAQQASVISRVVGSSHCKGSQRLALSSHTTTMRMRRSAR